MKILKIEHLGLACRSAESAAAFYSGVLGLPVVSRETLEGMKLKVVKVQSGGSVLELLEPLDGEPVISKFLAAKGEGIHHVCFQVEDLREAMKELRSKGYTPLWDEPQVGTGGKWVNFLRPKETFGVLLELNQDPS
ncbi:MAG TPA: methylmalonyl-CoA epimerase [Planctomycetota bacterium]|nr:methylmalonyl-CoA epimerase [Planctomycetota bacterium]